MATAITALAHCPAGKILFYSPNASVLSQFNSNAQVWNCEPSFQPLLRRDANICIWCDNTWWNTWVSHPLNVVFANINCTYLVLSFSYPNYRSIYDILNAKSHRLSRRSYKTLCVSLNTLFGLPLCCSLPLIPRLPLNMLL